MSHKMCWFHEAEKKPWEERKCWEKLRGAEKSKLCSLCIKKRFKAILTSFGHARALCNRKQKLQICVQSTTVVLLQTLPQEINIEGGLVKISCCLLSAILYNDAGQGSVKPCTILEARESERHERSHVRVAHNMLEGNGFGLSERDIVIL